MPGSTDKVLVPLFDAERLRSLERYAALEMKLAFLLSALLGVDGGKGFVIFYRITNTRSRYAIISDLLARSEFAETKPFWTSLEKALVKLDSFRNNIVHWVPWVELDDGGGPTKAKRQSPGHRGLGAHPDPITVERLLAFQEDISALTTPMVMYISYLRDPAVAPLHDTLRRIFLQPIDDQTTEALLSALNPTEP